LCLPCSHGPNPVTLSIAIASSCIENTQNLELATLLAGQIARAAAIFNVDEVVVVDDAPNKQPGRVSAAAGLFARVLQFMETPQYLRKCVISVYCLVLGCTWAMQDGIINTNFACM